jgi:hypothetical protein
MFVLRPDRTTIPIADNAAPAIERGVTSKTARASTAPIDNSSMPELSSASVPVAAAQVATPPDPDEDVVQSFVDHWKESPTLEQLSRRMKAEARDDAWASSMETQLGDYLARQPIPNALGSYSVACKLTICRVMSVVSPEAMVAAPNTDLQFALGSLQNESLGRELIYGGVSLGSDPKQPNQIVEISFLRRAGDPGNSRP